MMGLTEAQRLELHRDLLALKEEIAALLSRSGEEEKPVGLDRPIGRLSRMDALQQQSMARAGRTILEKRLRQVEAALTALAAGDYGECRSCEEPIDFDRLKARPESPYCLDCQSRAERRR